MWNRFAIVLLGIWIGTLRVFFWNGALRYANGVIMQNAVACHLAMSYIQLRYLTFYLFSYISLCLCSAISPLSTHSFRSPLIYVIQWIALLKHIHTCTSTSREYLCCCQRQILNSFVAYLEHSTVQWIFDAIYAQHLPTLPIFKWWCEFNENLIRHGLRGVNKEKDMWKREGYRDMPQVQPWMRTTNDKKREKENKLST